MNLSWSQAVAACPLIAILRGITPDKIEPAVAGLIDVGFRILEIPLNSPNAIESIRRAAEHYGDEAIIGAGTVLRADEVRDVKAVGGRLIVAPNFTPQVAAACREHDLGYGPGVATPSEAFMALEAGATFLKLFPAEMIPPPVVKAWRAVLPRQTGLFPVGGITPDAMKVYAEAGASGFGLGSALYTPHTTLEDLLRRGRDFVTHMPRSPG